MRVFEEEIVISNFCTSARSGMKGLDSQVFGVEARQGTVRLDICAIRSSRGFKKGAQCGGGADLDPPALRALRVVELVPENDRVFGVAMKSLVTLTRLRALDQQFQLCMYRATLSRLFVSKLRLIRAFEDLLKRSKPPRAYFTRNRPSAMCRMQNINELV
jgi:hypothetical protein